MQSDIYFLFLEKCVKMFNKHPTFKEKYFFGSHLMVKTLQGKGKAKISNET